MANTNMSTTVECNHCKHRFQINGQTIVSERQCRGNDGKLIYITYFDCPKCKERYYVQVDDQESIVQKNKCLVSFRSLAKLKIAKKKISKQQQDKFNKYREALKDMRFELMKQYNKTDVTDTITGEKMFVEFTVL